VAVWGGGALRIPLMAENRFGHRGLVAKYPNIHPLLQFDIILGKQEFTWHYMEILDSLLKIFIYILDLDLLNMERYGTF